MASALAQMKSGDGCQQTEKGDFDKAPARILVIYLATEKGRGPSDVA